MTTSDIARVGDAQEVPPPGCPSAAWVEVNEAKVFAARLGANWWITFRHHGPESRFQVVTASIGGDRVRVTCDDREHAAWLLAHIVEQGVPRTAVKVGAR